MSNSQWRPSASWKTFQVRAQMLTSIRSFFADRKVLEVETPALSLSAVTDPILSSFKLDTGTGGRWLHTSPEFSMKRLLAAHSRDIYQICKVFRAGEVGRYHNPEFTLLEWYRVGYDHWALMDEVDALLTYLLSESNAMATSSRVSYRDAFMESLDLDPMQTSVNELEYTAKRQNLNIASSLTLNQWLDLLFSQYVVTRFSENKLTFVYDYPAGQAALARISNTDPDIAERFEVFWGSLELANGFHELTDPIEQYRRFEQELKLRQERGLEKVRSDANLIAALQHGLPDCAGVALGLDRVLMSITGAQHIDEVLGFPWDRS